MSFKVNAPEYVFLISDLAGERRFASSVAKRLEGLGALTHGDRRATETCDLSQFNVFTKYGRSALRSVMGAVNGSGELKVPPPADYRGDFFQGIHFMEQVECCCSLCSSLDVYTALLGVGYFGQGKEEEDESFSTKSYDNISKFLNRILGIPVDLQNRLFKLYMDTLGVIISEAKKAGRYDRGIMDLGTEHDSVRRIKSSCFTLRHPTGRSRIVLDSVEIDRGISWQTAMDMEALLTGKHEGFYRSTESVIHLKFISLSLLIFC
jgi:C-terminal domain on Strawberry notch homologue